MIPFSVEFEEERWALRDDLDGLKAFDDAAEGAKTALPKMVVQAGGEGGRGRHACTAIVRCAITTPRIFSLSRFFYFFRYFFSFLSRGHPQVYTTSVCARGLASRFCVSHLRENGEKGGDKPLAMRSLSARTYQPLLAALCCFIPATFLIWTGKQADHDAFVAFMSAPSHNPAHRPTPDARAREKKRDPKRERHRPTKPAPACSEPYFIV